MPDHAKVTSLEAVENFRAKLIVYREKAGRVLDEVTDETIRTRVWLESDCPNRMEAELRRLNRELERRQQELFSAQIAVLQDASAVQQMAVVKARRAIREAEAKLQVIKGWKRQFDHQVEPLARQAEKLRHTLGHDLALAIGWLAEMIKTLAAYAEMSATGATARPAPETSEAGEISSTAPEGNTP
jgi:hypothetical protein